jgi:hypothetical protein
MKKAVLVFGLFFLVANIYQPVLAEEQDDDLDMLLESLDIEDDYVYDFPEIAPEIYLKLGFRIVDQDDSAEAFEYEYLDDSVTAGADIRMFNYPHRFYLDFDYLNKEDYFGDLRYAYGDLFLARILNNTFYHNLNNIRLYDYDPLTASPGVDVRDAGREYGLTVGETKFHFMFKAPNFPLHAYFDGFYLNRDGDQQQRNLLGSGFYNNMQRTSQKRDVDWTTRIYKVGVNSHLGLFEMDYAHTEKRFDVDDDPVFEDAYTPSGFRPAGVYQHSQVPETEGSSDSIKIHTSYTGKWVASASFFHDDRDNNESGADSETMVGQGSVIWNPNSSLAFSVRYAHRDYDQHSPSTVTVTDTANPANSFEYDVKKPIESNTDTVIVTGRYRPMKGLTFRAKYNYKEIDRTRAEKWNIEPKTKTNGVALQADSRLHRTLLLNLKYQYKNVDDPAYNTEPEDANSGRAALTWIPHPKVNFLLSYSLDRQDRDHMSFADTEEPWDRDADLDNFRAIGTFQPARNLTLSTSYGYMRYKVEQDLVYDNLAGDPQVDKNVPMEEKAHVYTIAAHYRFSEKLYLTGDISYTKSEGDFDPNSDGLLEPVSIASFSELDRRDFILHLGGEYSFENGLSMGLDYRYGDLDDKSNNIYGDVEDGEAHIISINASKKW